MSDAIVTISADEVGEASGSDGTYAFGLDRVRVSLAGEARCNGDEETGAEYRCRLCGLTAYEAWDDGRTIYLHHDQGEANRLHDDAQDDEGTCAEGAWHADPEPVPLSWANSAAISLDESEDTITVTISVGDPRGAFVMRVERMRYTGEDGTERDELRLSVPTPSDGWLHMPLAPLASPGYFRIGA